MREYYERARPPPYLSEGTWVSEELRLARRTRNLPTREQGAGLNRKRRRHLRAAVSSPIVGISEPFSHLPSFLLSCGVVPPRHREIDPSTVHVAMTT